MLTIADIEPHIEREFGSPLESLGFRKTGKRRWVRSQKLPIRELFTIGKLKGGRFSPYWGFSLGITPSFKGQTFQRQSTDKTLTMDLIIDPIDLSGNVPAQTFSFITGYDSEIPTQKIKACAEYFIPLAAADFARVTSVNDFCNLFLERSQLHYRRFQFDNYIQHQLAYGFVLLLTGNRDDGIKKIETFCSSMDLEFDNRILRECIANAEKLMDVNKERREGR